ncbi:MAG: hypothetical protein GXP31_13150 [Kiritimatiellaeota bacterium]|nr:hypothetical protein [Kiritimatiellota bacterium]
MKALQDPEDLFDVFPGPGEYTNMVTLRALHGYEFIAVLIRALGRVDRLICSTFNAGETVTEQLDRGLASGTIITADMVVNGIMARSREQAAPYLALRELARSWPGRFRLGTGRIHAKVIAAISGRDALVVLGSGNLATNENIETYVIMNSLDVALFHAKWIGDILHRCEKHG